MKAVIAEREARDRLPSLLADLVGSTTVTLSPPALTGPVDIAASDEDGRIWLIEVKSTSRPDQVVSAAQQLRSYGGPGVPLLVVPYMSPHGAKAASEQGLNWLDLSGNARIRTKDLYVRVEGRTNSLRSPGRPTSPFAPRGARVTRALLDAPLRYWRQYELVAVTGLTDGSISRVVGRLDRAGLLQRHGPMLRPRDPSVLLDAWEQDYRFDAHDAVLGHVSGSGQEVTEWLAQHLMPLSIHFAFTGLAAAWCVDRFARYRLTTVFVDMDPRTVADRLAIRREPRGANVQLLCPNDEGVFMNEQYCDGLPCVATVQTYLDLRHLPERAQEAADHLRAQQLRWRP